MTEQINDIEITIHIPKFNPPDIKIDPVLVGRMIEAGHAISLSFNKVAVAQTGVEAEKENGVAVTPGWFMLDSEILDAAEKSFEEILALESGTPTPEHQRAHERSKTDRRRKSRRGKYKWGGSDD